MDSSAIKAGLYPGRYGAGQLADSWPTSCDADVANGASGSFDPAIAGCGPARVAGSRLATSQAVALAIVYASQLDPRSWNAVVGQCSIERVPLEALGSARVRFLSDPLGDVSLLADDVVGVLLVDDLFDLCCLVSGHHDE
jgi:hypothetical protein